MLVCHLYLKAVHVLCDKPRRLSTDVDIIVKPGTDLDGYLDKASEIFPFQMVEEQRRCAF